jgi:uncharacterized membrane protein YidH (DUF202 family)
MTDRALILIVIIGLALLISIQGYSFLMQGQALLEPEQRLKSAGRFVYTGLALVFIGALVAVIALLLLFLPAS